MYARSLAGHDKGKLYVIIQLDETYAYLADGDHRPAERPKKKKWKHIQPDHHIYEKLKGSETTQALNQLIREAIKCKEMEACLKQM